MKQGVRAYLLLSILTFKLKASDNLYENSSDSDSQTIKDRLLSPVTLGNEEGLMDGSTIIEDKIGVTRDFSENSPNSNVSNVSPYSLISSLTSSSPELTSKFTHFDNEHSRPRGSSFHHNHATPPKHVSFGWIQFSDDRWMPSEHMEDTEDNRRHILMMMLADARHGNLEYFRYLVSVLESFPSPEHSKSSDLHELDYYNPNSLIFAAVHSDNVELFLEVMKFKKISFEQLDPFHSSARSLDQISPGTSYPPKRRSYLESVDSDDSGDEQDIPNSDETVFGQAVIQNSIEIVNLLIDTGMRDSFPEHTTTALHLAIEHGHETLIKILLNRADSKIDRINGALMSSLMIAIAAGYPKIVKLLLKLDASMFITDFHRKNCLHYAAEMGDFEILRLLKEVFMKMTQSSRDMLINAEDVKKRTPLECSKDAVVQHYILNNFTHE